MKKTFEIYSCNSKEKKSPIGDHGYYCQHWLNASGVNTTTLTSAAAIRNYNLQRPSRNYL